MQSAEVLVLLCLATCPILATDVSQCFVPDSDTATVKFSLICRRNQTGYWTARLDKTPTVSQNGNQLSGEIVESTSISSDKTISVFVDATINVPLKSVVDFGRRQRGPPSGYIHWFGSSYYKFHPEAKTWVEARDTCVQEGAHLVVVNSEGEAKFVSSLWNAKNDFASIGMHDLYIEGVFVTLFNETQNAAGYDKWFQGEPNGGSNENCGVIHRNSLLASSFCHVGCSFICELVTDTTKDSPAVKEVEKSPPGYTWFDFSFYKIHPETQTWMQARDVCTEEGGHLAVVNSEGAARFLTAIWNSKRDWAFIGTHDFNTEGQYVTIFNEALDVAGYNKWYQGEPDGGTNQNCGFINRNSLLGNGFCYRPESFICEIESAKVPRKENKHDPLEEYARFGNSYYKAHPETKTWVEARDACAEEGAHLAVINSDAEAKFVTSLWNSKKEWAFIGTHDMFTEGLYVTIFNDTLDVAGYNRWHKGEPDGATSQNCGFINRNTLLGNGFCYQPESFICEFESTEGHRVPQKYGQKVPPFGYTHWFGYYRAHAEPKTWTEARDACSREGAHLAVINSEGEAKFVTSLWNSNSQWAYIGTHDFYTEGLYTTIFNQTLDAAGYNKWVAGEPNGGTGENCGLINKNSLLGNYFCYLPMPFICEIPPKGVEERWEQTAKGYTHWPGLGYYKAHTEPKDWFTAREICKLEGAHLAAINSEAEAKVLTSLWNTGADWALIGMHDQYREGVFTTIFNEPQDAAGYNKWFPGEPNGGTAENCGVVNKNSLLGSGFCNRQAPFFCEVNESAVMADV